MIAAPSDKPCILIVEDEPGIADTLQYVLRSDGFVPQWCGTAEAALARVAQALDGGAGTAPLPALAILDVGLPDLNGFELFKRLQALLRARNLPELPVVFLTARSDEIDRVVGLELGADDYVAKPFSPRELVARVRSILRRSQRGAAPLAAAVPPPSAAAPLCFGPFAVDAERMQIRYHGRLLELSRYEYGLLRLLVQRPGRVFTRDELLAQVWDAASDPFDRTVDAHVKTLRAKLRAIAPAQEPIRTLRGTGYALNEDLPHLP